MTTSKNNRSLAVIAAAQEAGFKVNRHMEHSAEVEAWILANTITKSFENGDSVEAVVVNNKFIAATYFVAAQKRNWDIEEDNFAQLRADYNF